MHPTSISHPADIRQYHWTNVSSRFQRPICNPTDTIATFHHNCRKCWRWWTPARIADCEFCDLQGHEAHNKDCIAKLNTQRNDSEVGVALPGSLGSLWWPPIVGSRRERQLWLAGADWSRVRVQSPNCTDRRTEYKMCANFGGRCDVCQRCAHISDTLLPNLIFQAADRPYLQWPVSRDRERHRKTGLR